MPQTKKISIEEQLTANRQHADKIGAQVVAELVVPGKSRNIILVEEACTRIPAYKQLVEMIDARAFDVLVYLDRSRLGRKASLSMAIVELCHEAGISTYETESGSLQQGSTYDQMLVGAIKSVGAQQEIHKFVERRRFGMIARVKRGEVPARISYGYRAVYTESGARTIVIDEQAAKVVRLIYELFLSGHSLHHIADTLNQQGHAGIQQARWTYSTVRGVLLRPWRYAGHVEFNHRSTTGWETVRAVSAAPAIITPEQAAQAEMRFTKPTGTRVPRIPNLFTGVVWCDVCGAVMRKYGGEDRPSGVGWRCSQRHKRATVSDAFIREAVRAAIIELANHLDDDLLVDSAVEVDEGLHQAIEQTMRDLAECDVQIERADDAFTAGVMDLARYTVQVNKIEARRVALTQQLKQLKAQCAELEYSADVISRREELAAHGLELLESSDIVSANAFFRKRLRVWCADYKPRRIEFL